MHHEIPLYNVAKKNSYLENGRFVAINSYFFTTKEKQQENEDMEKTKRKCLKSFLWVRYSGRLVMRASTLFRIINSYVIQLWSTGLCHYIHFLTITRLFRITQSNTFCFPWVWAWMWWSCSLCHWKASTLDWSGYSIPQSGLWFLN